MEKVAKAIAENNGNDEIKSDEKKETVNFKNEEIPSTSAHTGDEPMIVGAAAAGAGVKSLNMETESKSANVEEIIAAIESCQVHEVSMNPNPNPIAEMNSNSDNCDEKRVGVAKENASQSAENCGQNLNPETEVENVTRETSEGILSAEEIDVRESQKSILSAIETNLVDSILEYCPLDESKYVSRHEEHRLKKMITNTFPRVSINKVEKLSNKYLYAAFMLKKNEKRNYRILEMIHSTAANNVSSIEKENLNWRRVNRAKYGKGVSFSTNADYANYHSSWSGGNRRAFIICDVLADSIRSVGDNQLNAPDGNIDTFKSHNGHVYVKFDDFTIYPKYALYYNKPSDEESKFYNRRRNRSNRTYSYDDCDDTYSDWYDQVTYEDFGYDYNDYDFYYDSDD